MHKAAVIKDMGGKVLVTAPPAPAQPSDPVERAKRDLVRANRILASDDVGVLDALGNVSVRNPNNPNTYFVAPKVAAGAVKAADVIERDITKGDTDAEGLLIHDEVYRTHPEVKAIGTPARRRSSSSRVRCRCAHPSTAATSSVRVFHWSTCPPPPVSPSSPIPRSRRAWRRRWTERAPCSCQVTASWSPQDRSTP